MKQGFTLVELLVVVAVIAVLAALLFPALAKAKRASHKSVCTSNLSQVAKAALLYADGSDGMFPAELGQVAGVGEVLICPADPHPESGAWCSELLEPVAIEVPCKSRSSYGYFFGPLGPGRQDKRTMEAMEGFALLACMLHGESEGGGGGAPPLRWGTVLQALPDSSVRVKQVALKKTATSTGININDLFQLGK